MQVNHLQYKININHLKYQIHNGKLKLISNKKSIYYKIKLFHFKQLI